MKDLCVATLIAIVLGGCSRFAYYNLPADPSQPATRRATFNIQDDRGEKDVLVLLALSGGGSRSAYFSSAVMLRLQQVFPDLDLLQEVDVISAVSGGSLPAAYYAISRDHTIRIDGGLPPGLRAHPKLHYDPATRVLSLTDTLTPMEVGTVRAAFTDLHDLHRFERLVRQQTVASNRIWDTKTVKALMGRNYIGRWVGNWFWPENILRYWFTAYDRSDIMAQTFADNLYDVRYTGRDLTFNNINPERPYLILNATNATEKVAPDDPAFGALFTFTDEDFRTKANSDISSYLVSRGVATSSAFPGLFNSMTLRNYLGHRKQYLHLFDGGNADNLGLTSLKRIILDVRVNPPQRYRKIVVVLVDAFVRSKGMSRDRADGRCPFFCYVADLNAVDAVASLLGANRAGVLQDFTDQLNVKRDCDLSHLPPEICDSPTLLSQISDVKSKLFFYHVRFEDSQLTGLIENIPTRFRLTNDQTGQSNAVHLDTAAMELINDQNACLQRIRRIVRGEETDADVRSGIYCTFHPGGGP